MFVNTTGFSYSNSGLLKQWHLLDLVYAYKIKFGLEFF